MARLFTLFSLCWVLLGCELVADFDRSKIPDDRPRSDAGGDEDAAAPDAAIDRDASDDDASVREDAGDEDGG